MILKAFSLLDTKVGMFTTPFFFNHTGQAIRAVVELASDSNTTVGRHPADFCLLEIGTFDDATGALNPFPPPEPRRCDRLPCTAEADDAPLPRPARSLAGNLQRACL